MKKFIAFLIVFLAIAGCSSSDTGGEETGGDDGDSTAANTSVEPIEIVLGTFFSPNDPFIDHVFNPWVELVEEKTNGRVKVESFHGGQLGSLTTALQDIAGGVYDVGFISAIVSEDTEVYPFAISSLPFAFPDAQTGHNVMNKFFEKYKDPQEVIYLGIAMADQYVIWSTSPIRTVEDLKGKKVRGASEMQVELIKKYGATPVSIPQEDLYESLQRGTVDAAIYTMTGGANFKLQEAAPYITKLPITSTAMIPAMNKDAFNKLPDDLKTLFEEELGPALAQLFTDHCQNYPLELEEILRQEVEGRGEFIALSEEEIAQFSAYAEDIWYTWAEKTNGKGYPGDEMLNDFISFAKEEGIRVPTE